MLDMHKNGSVFFNSDFFELDFPYWTVLSNQKLLQLPHTQKVLNPNLHNFFILCWIGFKDTVANLW